MNTSQRMLVVCAGSLVLVASIAASSNLVAAPRPPAPTGQVDREALLEAHAKDEKGGSAAAGRPLFEKLCAGCHRFGAIGKDVGPDLTTITSRFKKRDILESILFPSKVISDQYQAEMIELTDGKLITGVLVRESATAILVRTGENPDKPVPVQKAQIANRTPSTVSLMPPGLIDTLSHAEVEDLLSFMMAPAPDK